MPAPWKIWEDMWNEAEAQAKAQNFSNVNQVNAFAHMYTSAKIARDYGVAVSFVMGVALELKNHVYDYADGGTNANDPYQSRDSFRDLWNDKLGLDLGVVASDNRWSDNQIASVAAEAVIRERAIVYRYVGDDNRIPVDLWRYSVIDYFWSVAPTIEYIKDILPTGTVVRQPDTKLLLDIPTTYNSFIVDGAQYNVSKNAASNYVLKISDLDDNKLWENAGFTIDQYGGLLSIDSTNDDGSELQLHFDDSGYGIYNSEIAIDGSRKDI